MVRGAQRKKMAKQNSSLKQEIIEACLAMNSTGLNQGKSGNISVRTETGFAITASGIAYDHMVEEHIVEMDLEGGYYGSYLPSSEWCMHLDIFAARPEAQAVVHTHSPHATAVSCLRKDLPAFHYMIAIAGGKSLRCAEYATFGTPELSLNMLAALQNRSACLLANHGLICFGANLESAFALAVEVEALCQQYILACQMGDPIILDDAEMDRVLERFKTYGKQPSELELMGATSNNAPEKRD